MAGKPMADRHGHACEKPSRTYNSWANMIQRCTNPNHHKYKRYGGRGIRVCEKWAEFGGFLDDMGAAPDRHMIERIDNDGHYCKENCKWATRREQANNRSNNRLITLDGETQTAAQWCEDLGLSFAAVRQRLYRGWSIERTFKQPIRRQNVALV